MSKTKSTAKANFEKTPRKPALKIATKLSSMLESLCEKVTIVGSIRRGKDMVGDIDIVVIPTDVNEFIDTVKEIIERCGGAVHSIDGVCAGEELIEDGDAPGSNG